MLAGIIDMIKQNNEKKKKIGTAQRRIQDAVKHFYKRS